MFVGDAFCDPRLQKLDIEYWTKVPIQSQAAMGALTFYLSYEQPIVGFLDADLFVGDLIAKRERFCSRFLVRALLHWATVSDSPSQFTCLH